MPASMKQELEKQGDPLLQAQAVAGTVTVHEQLQEKVAKGDTLFLFVREKGRTSGPPLAVKRESVLGFPHEFSISPADSMIDGTQFSEELSLTARLDRDGQAGQGPGDIEGRLVVKKGEKNIVLVLKDEVPEAGNFVSGTLSLDPALGKKAEEYPYLFIIARQEGQSKGPPLAVKRLQKVEFPYTYRIGQADTMMPGIPFAGSILITVRLDQDGDAQAGSGDVEGTRATQAGENNVDILLNRVVGG